MLGAEAKYVVMYNPGMHDQLLQFDEEIQTKSIQYDWMFLGKMIVRVIKGLNTKTYYLTHTSRHDVSPLGKKKSTRNTVAMAAANRRNAEPHATDIKEKNACAFHNGRKR